MSGLHGEGGHAGVRWTDPEWEDGPGSWNVLEDERGFLHEAARRRLGQHAASEFGISDLVQETIIEGKRHASGFRGKTRGEWRAWLLSVLRSRLSRRRRNTHLAVSQAGPLDDRCGPVDPATSPSGAAIRAERAAALVEALSQLRPDDRELLRLRHQDRLEFEPIARRLFLPTADAARKRYARAISQLRTLIGPAHDPG